MEFKTGYSHSRQPLPDFSIAGRQKGADPGSGTRSSLMWETLNIVKNMGLWRPKNYNLGNVKNVRKPLHGA